MMPVIFDLQETNSLWATMVNEALEADWPEYIEKNGAVGTDLWWRNYERGALGSKLGKGVVTFVGRKTDFFGEEYHSVEIDLAGVLKEYDRCGYWERSEIVVGAKIVIESFEIRFQARYGPMIFEFEKSVEVTNA